MRIDELEPNKLYHIIEDTNGSLPLGECMVIFTSINRQEQMGKFKWKGGDWEEWGSRPWEVFFDSYTFQPTSKLEQILA